MQDTDDTPSRSGIQSIARAAVVLRSLQDVPDGLTLGEIAAAVDLPKSTVHRLVGALAEESFVTPASDGRVRLGSGLARLALASRDSLRHELRPVLADLRQEIDETVDLAVLDGTEARFIDQVDAAHRLRAVSAVGARFPLHCSANGKALLAALGDDRVAEILPADLPRFTPATIVTRDDLLTELARVRAAGVAFDREEHTAGISAVGAVVFDDTAAPVAAISVPVPTSRFDGNEEPYAKAVRAAAARASKLLTR